MLWVCYLYFLVLLTNFKVHGEISSSSDLNCDFKSTCRWRNSTDGGGHFEMTTLLEADAQNRIMPLDESDPSPFAYTSGLMGRTLALLVSEVITCQLGGASIKYWYYKTGLSSSLEVCIRQPPGNRDVNAMRCYDGVSATFGKQWIFRAVELPPIAQPFEIVFKTFYNPPTDVIALDNIVFESTLCESSTGGASEGAGGTFDDFGVTVPQFSQLADFNGNDVTIDTSRFEEIPAPLTSKPVHHAAPTASQNSLKKGSDLGGPRVGPMFSSMCPLVDCTFDDNTICNYVTSSTNQSAEDGSTLKKWLLSNRSVLNSLTGGYFLYSGGVEVSPDDTFIMSSNKPVNIREPARVDFFVYQAGIRGQFRVCVDDDAECPIVLDGRDIDVDSQKWRNYYFDVSPGEHVFHFIVNGLHDNYAIGLDNIQLLNRFGTSALSC